MGIVAPVTGVMAALIPVGAGIVLEGVPAPLVLFGIGLGMGLAGPIFPRFAGAVDTCRRTRGHQIGRAALSQCEGRDARRGAAAKREGGAMYPVVYWAGVATLIVWTAYSAYSAIVGL